MGSIPTVPIDGGVMKASGHACTMRPQGALPCISIFYCHLAYRQCARLWTESGWFDSSGGDLTERSVEATRLPWEQDHAGSIPAAQTYPETFKAMAEPPNLLRVGSIPTSGAC